MSTTKLHTYRRDLAEPFGTPTLIYPYDLRNASTSREMAAVHALLTSVYAARGRWMPNRAEWWQSLLADPAFDPSLVFMIVTPNGILTAACMATMDGRVNDLVVAPSFRQLGLGTALLEHACLVFRERGLATAEVRLEADNQAAISVCEALGLRRVGLFTPPVGEAPGAASASSILPVESPSN